jgi:hypothetical protein
MATIGAPQEKLEVVIDAIQYARTEFKETVRKKVGNLDTETGHISHDGISC